MKKLLILLFLTLVACDNSSSTASMDKYFSNCVDDYLKVKKKERTKNNIYNASSSCQGFLRYVGDKEKFRYFKGKIWSAGYGR